MVAQRTRRSGVLALALAAVLPAQAEEPARIIDRITVIRKNVFDTEKPEERHAFGSMVNMLHVVTDEAVVRHELLYREGDPLDAFLLAETERNLRALGFLGEVQTRVDTAGESGAAVTITTQDKWSIDFLPAYKQEGGVRTYRFTVKDDNFLGNGQSLSFGYLYNSSHPSPHGTDLAFRERSLLRSRVAASLRYRKSWESHLGSISLERPYYSDRADWAGGLSGEFGRRRFVYYRGGQIAEDGESSYELQSAWLSTSIGSSVLWRPTLSYTRTRSGMNQPRVFDNLDMVGAGITVLARSFVERSFLNNFGRVEDVPLGTAAGISAGKNFWSRPGLSPDYTVSVFGRQAVAAGRAYLAWEGSATSYFGGAVHHETTVSVLLLHHFKVSRLQTLVAWATATAGFGWSASRQIFLGSSSGLRGHAEYELAGNRRITYGLEHRLFSDVDLFIFRVGAAAFLDGGTTWFGDAPVTEQRFHQGAGVGLRIENTKLQGAGLIRIDVAMNLDRGRFSQVILSSALPISAFLPLDGAGAWHPPENR